MPADLDLVRRLSAAEHGLAVVATTRADGTVHASVVNAGVLDDPLLGVRGGDEGLGRAQIGGNLDLAGHRSDGRQALPQGQGVVKEIADLE